MSTFGTVNPGSLEEATAELDQSNNQFGEMLEGVDHKLSSANVDDYLAQLDPKEQEEMLVLLAELPGSRELHKNSNAVVGASSDYVSALRVLIDPDQAVTADRAASPVNGGSEKSSPTASSSPLPNFGKTVSPYVSPNGSPQGSTQGDYAPQASIVQAPVATLAY